MNSTRWARRAVPHRLREGTTNEQTLNQLLVEMDGFDSRKGVSSSATNRPEILDPALLRPGRFDRQVLVDRPDLNGREEILRLHARKVRLSPNVDLRTIAARTPGFVGADLANIINEAALLAAVRTRRRLRWRTWKKPSSVLSPVLRRKIASSKKEQQIVAYHEAGHAPGSGEFATPTRCIAFPLFPVGLRRWAIRCNCLPRIGIW